MKTKPIFRSPAAFCFFLAYFLEQEGCRLRFINNLDDYSSFSDYCFKAYNHINSNSSCLDKVISGAFMWSLTPEKSEFWNRVNRHWLKALEL